MDWISVGVSKGYIEILNDGQIIKYVKTNKSYQFTDPEEEVRASLFVELIEKYKYEETHIDLEVTVPRRTPKDLADIVIFKDNKHKDPYIVIECKKAGINDAEFNQAIEQCFGNSNSLAAKYALVVAGNTRRAFEVQNHKPLERTDNIIADIPVSYGTVQDWRFKKGDPNWDLQVIDRHGLIRVLEKCHDTLWQGGKLAPTVAFDELCKIIFVKIRDERVPRKIGEHYSFQIKTHEKPNAVKQRIDDIYREARKIDPEVFAEEIKVNEKQLFSVVNHLQSIFLTATELDVKGVAFERFMEDFFKGKNGQFFTPREVVKFMVEMTEPSHETKVIDPACGSGGFLLNCLDFVRKSASLYYDENTPDHFNFWHNFATRYLCGIEINDSISVVAKMNMILHNDGHTNVIGSDGLCSFDKLYNINRKFTKESFDLVLTNPPFGSVIKKEEVDYLEHYELGKIRNSQKTEILFIERCFELLKWNKGIMGIVLPNGILSNTTLSYVREFILERFEILAIITLPAFAFTHYGAGVESSLLFLRKISKKQFDKYQAQKMIIKSNQSAALNNKLMELKKNFKFVQNEGSPSQQRITDEYSARFKALLVLIDECLIALGRKSPQKIDRARDKFLRIEDTIKENHQTNKLTKVEQASYSRKLKELTNEFNVLEYEYKNDFKNALDHEWLALQKEKYTVEVQMTKDLYSEITSKELHNWIATNNNYPIFFSLPQHIGYDATGRKSINKLPAVIKAFKQFLTAKANDTWNNLVANEYGELNDYENTFIVERKNLINRLDPYYYQPKFRSLEKYLNDNYTLTKLGDLGEVFDGPFGSNLKNDEYVDSGIPLFRVQNVRDGEVYFDKMNTVYISPEKHEQLKRSEVKPGDVVITKTGWLGNAAVIPPEIQVANIRADLAGVRLHSDAPVLPEYLAVFIDGPIGKQLCARLTSGSTRDRMVISNVKNIPIPILDIEKQRLMVQEVKKKREQINVFKRQVEELSLQAIEQTEKLFYSFAIDFE